MLSGVERNKTVEGWWRCSNAASDDVAPRIWRRQHVIMKTRFVSVSRCKSNPRGMIGTSRVLSCGILALIPVFSCQSRMCFRCICVFTSSNFLCMAVATWSVWLWNYAELWKCNQGEASITIFFQKEFGALWTITVRRSIRTIRTIPNIIVSKPLPLFIIDIYTLHQYCGMIRVVSTSLWSG